MICFYDLKDKIYTIQKIDFIINFQRSKETSNSTFLRLKEYNQNDVLKMDTDDIRDRCLSEAQRDVNVCARKISSQRLLDKPYGTRPVPYTPLRIRNRSEIKTSAFSR